MLGRLALLALVVGLAAAYVVRAARHPWDFETYYYAASAYRAGLDPYLLPSLSSVAGKPIELPFLYPPVTLALFLPFTYLAFGPASLLWLGVECLIASALVWVWWRNFLRPVAPDLLVAAALLGFDLALLWNLRTGNVALVEQALVWLGLVAYTRGRFLRAAVLIGLASIFKLYPIVFFALLLSPSGRRGKAIPIVLGLAVCGSLLAVPMAPHASWAHSLVAAIKQGPLPPNFDPSSLSLAGWALSLSRAPIATVQWMAPALYILFVATLLWASRSMLARAFRSSDLMARVMTALILMYLVSPRVMVYSYASAIPPALFVLHRTIAGRPWRVGASLLLLLQGLVRFLPGSPPTWLGAVSFLIMLAVWILWTRAEGIRAGAGGTV